MPKGLLLSLDDFLDLETPPIPLPPLLSLLCGLSPFLKESSFPLDPFVKDSYSSYCEEAITFPLILVVLLFMLDPLAKFYIKFGLV